MKCVTKEFEMLLLYERGEGKRCVGLCVLGFLLRPQVDAVMVMVQSNNNSIAL